MARYIFEDSQPTDDAPLASRYVFEDEPAVKDADIDRSVGEVIKDTGAGLMGGFASLGGTLTQLADVVTFGMFDTGARKLFADANAYWNDQKSESLKQAQLRLEDADGAAETLSAIWKKPELLGDLLSSSLSFLLIPGATARGVGSRVLAKTLDKVAASRAATKAGIITGGVLEGASAGSEKYNEVAQMTPAQLFEVSTPYQEMRADGLDHKEAIDKLAFRSGLTAQAIATPISILASKITGAGKLEADFFTGKGFKGLTGLLVKEPAEEFLQESGNLFGQNVADVVVTNEVSDPFRGTVKAGTLGAIAGLAQGAGMKATGGILESYTRRRQDDIDQAGRNAIDRGGNAVDAEIAKAFKALEIPPEPTPSEEPLITPDERRKAEAVDLPGYSTLSEAKRRDRMAGIDGDILIASRNGFEEEAVRLTTARRMYQMADAARESGNQEAAGRGAKRGNDIYRDIMGDPAAAEETSGGMPASTAIEGEIIPAMPSQAARIGRIGTDIE